MSLSSDRKNAIFLLVILAIIAVVIVAVSISLKVDPIAEISENETVVTTLWILKDEDGSALSTYVLIFYPRTNAAAAFDIPGNVGAIYSSIGRVDRIDAIYGELGLSSYKAEIEKLIGRQIPFTIELELSDLEFLADYLGGLNVFVAFPIDETVEYQETVEVEVPAVTDDQELTSEGELVTQTQTVFETVTRKKHYLLPSGAVALDGDKIRDFATYDRDDEGETHDRRQAIFTALLYALRENRTSLFRGNNFAPYEKHITSNLEGKDLSGLMEMISAVDVERLSLQTVTGSLRVVEDKTLLFPYYDGQLIKDVVNQAVSSLLSGSGDNQSRVYVLSILNGSGEQGLARNTAFLLQSAGYEVLETANADRSDYEKTVIIDHIANETAAQSLGDFIHCDNIVSDDEERNLADAAQVDFTLILGRDFNGRYVK